ncbi:MAG: hypothetical protein AB4368_27720 [Xenococcaceae cyanobacterium]
MLITVIFDSNLIPSNLDGLILFNSQKNLILSNGGRILYYLDPNPLNSPIFGSINGLVSRSKNGINYGRSIFVDSQLDPFADLGANPEDLVIDVFSVALHELQHALGLTRVNQGAKEKSTIQFINSGSLNPGKLSIFASGSLISKGDSNSNTGFFTFILGDKITPAHNIEIETPILLLQDNSQIISFASNISEASAGNITVRASESINLTGANTIISSQGGTGDSGRIDVNTKNLKLQDGGRILASANGSGQAGNIEINAQESVKS